MHIHKSGLTVKEIIAPEIWERGTKYAGDLSFQYGIYERVWIELRHGCTWVIWEGTGMDVTEWKCSLSDPDFIQKTNDKAYERLAHIGLVKGDF